MESLFLGNNQWFLLLQPGELLMQSITSFAKQNNIYCAKVEGIGAIKATEVGYINQETKTYHRKKFTGNMELISTSGNITKLDTGEPFAHIHISFTENNTNKVLGGHCFSAEIGAVAEIIITVFEAEIPRKFTSLNTLCPVTLNK